MIMQWLRRHSSESDSRIQCQYGRHRHVCIKLWLMHTTLSPWFCWNGFNIVAIFYVQLQTPSHHWSPVIVDIPTSNCLHLPCTILIRDPIAQISATKSEMPAPVNFNFCLRPSSCSLSFPISVSKGSIGMLSVLKISFFCGIWYMFSPSILQRSRR